MLIIVNGLNCELFKLKVTHAITVFEQKLVLRRALKIAPNNDHHPIRLDLIKVCVFCR